MTTRRDLLCATVLCAIAPTLVASGQRQIDIPERIHGAGKVVVATATTVIPTWRKNAFGDELIVSEVSLRIEETLKGQPNGVAVLELEGGTLDGVTLKVSSLPEIAPGERGVFFLDSTPRGLFVPHLKGLGILKLDRDNRVRGSSLRLEDIRTMARSGR